MASDAALDPRPLLLKRMTWDVLPHDYDTIREAQERLGLLPDDDEGMDVEHVAADARHCNVCPLSEAVDFLAGLAGDVVTQYIAMSIEGAHDDGAEIPEDVLAGFGSQNAGVISQGALAIISHLIDTGVLRYGDAVLRMAGAGGAW